MKRLLVIFLFSILGRAYGQDMQYTQYYAAPLLLNPAFAGTSNDHRLILNYRNQWPSLPQGFTNYALSYDYNMSDYRSGVGFVVNVDNAGSANLRSTNIQFMYAYKVQISDKWVFSPGLYFGYGQKSVDFNKLIFADQLQFDASGSAPTQDLSVSQNIQPESHFDFGSGVLLYSEKVWIGVSSYHMNQPNQSLLGEESRLPMKTSVHAGVRIPLYTGPFRRNQNSSIAPSFVYKKQGDFDQLDIGLHFLYEPIIVGLWYRGIPLQQNVKDNISQDAIALILGMRLDFIDVGYSYDFTISELGPTVGGAHEISISYTFDVKTKKRMKRKDKFIPCPTFIRN
ncbi:MAG: type IX secretion system membrane protein PorP/SprF [Cyclobacteriaceae bacterium]|nr:type IX secretion system membrane protein PorP/SprF [Cyclobacteriaceae bacterium]